MEQIVAVLKRAEAGAPLAELIRRVGILERPFYRWKKQFVGLGVDQVRQLRQLQEENTRLKQVVAELTLDKNDVSEFSNDCNCFNIKDSSCGGRVAQLGEHLPCKYAG